MLDPLAVLVGRSARLSGIPTPQASRLSRRDDLQTRAKAHPYADILPLLEGEAFDALVADIKANGLLEPITIYEGMILDGRNRLRACEAAGVEPRFVDYDGDDPLASCCR